MSFRTLLLCAVALPLLIGGTAAIDSGPETLANQAMGSYQQGLELMDERFYWDAVDVLSDCFQRYPDSTISKNNHLTAAEICFKKIGTPEAYTVGENILRHYLATYGNPREMETRDIQLALVQLNYSYRHDYNAAATELNIYYQAYQDQQDSDGKIVPILTAGERITAKLVEAKINRKQGNFGAARGAYAVAEQYSRQVAAGDPNARLNFQKEIALCQAVEQGVTIEDAPHHIRLISGVSNPTGTRIRDAFRAAASDLQWTLGIGPSFPLDIYVFPDERTMESLTGRPNAFVAAVDGDLYLLPNSDPKPLLAMIAALSWKIRPTDEIPAVLAEGLPTSQAESYDPWPDAARQSRMLGRNFTPSVLLDPVTYYELPEASALSASFVEFLIERYGIARFAKLYSGWETLTTGKFDPNPMFAATEVLNLAGMERGFNEVMGVSLTTAWNAWDTELGRVADGLQADFERQGGALKVVRIDDSTPEAVIASWFAALQGGDLGAMEKMATSTLRPNLETVRADYEAAGALEAARLWSLAIPYSKRTYEVLDRRVLESSAFFLLAIQEGSTTVRRAEVTLVLEGGKWRMSSGF